ncbi:hypothetical protein BT63DRAFT_458379 [Microthyrium microscopicum]|uniref:Uncharacterized protein n=1 Tax=Microthyrium microscopicum TaxID=703497 RepID=A0A6A6U3K3_9PEZI|nr:hypothetical protein BT63DRAFT_458379 [Microthyrium microscopicum]
MSSGAAPERNMAWRRSGQPSGPRQPPPGADGQGTTPRDRTNTPNQRGNQGNARGGRSASRNNVQLPAQAQAQAQVQPPTVEKTQGSANVSNGDEIRQAMKKSYTATVAASGHGEKALQVKKGDSGANRGSAPWGSAPRPNLMANGQNFWTELVKQVKVLEDGGKPSTTKGEGGRKGK